MIYSPTNDMLQGSLTFVGSIVPSFQTGIPHFFLRFRWFKLSLSPFFFLAGDRRPGSAGRRQLRVDQAQRDRDDAQRRDHHRLRRHAGAWLVLGLVGMGGWGRVLRGKDVRDFVGQSYGSCIHDFFVTISLESMMIPLHSTTLLSLDWFEEKIQEAPVFNVKIFP